MKNKEKYLYEILESFAEDTTCEFKIKHIRNNSCQDITCEDCTECTKEWLEKEYKEPIKLSNVEKMILKYIDCSFKYIYYNENGHLVVTDHKIMPSKSYVLPFKRVFNDLKDGEYYSIDELLGEYDE